MTRQTGESFTAALAKLAKDLTATFRLPLNFNPEDQLKPAVKELIERAGAESGMSVDVVTEVQQKDIAGRPDMGVTVRSLLAGHIELKAPGKGANPSRLKGADHVQWAKFQDLPNLIYTDGNEWALFRSGKHVGTTVRMAGDVTTDGADAVTEANARSLLDLLRDFLRWEPIVPSSPRALAEMLAPICRLLRLDVIVALENPDSNLSSLAADWRRYLFPDADDAQFADAYAQTLTYALLLARLTGADADLDIPSAAKALRTGHRLLADTLKILGDEAAREEIVVPVDLLERIIGAVDAAALTSKAKGDPWLYFYEDFLAAYDPKMRKDRGVFYTPVPVVQTQVRLVAELLTKHFDAEFSFVDPKVTTLDPAAGTATYILAAIEHSLDQVARVRGPGMRAQAATTAASRIYAFELLVGPYAVAHLRLTQQILAAGGKVPDDGVHVYLTDTLESPNALQPPLPALYKELGEEHKRAQAVKSKTRIVVCIGNPPYDRQTRDEEEAKDDKVKLKGGWVRFGDQVQGAKSRPLLEDFLAPLSELGLGVHAKNLYNDYIYFWRWALWKVFEVQPGPGIVSFITASSYLRGPGFAGVRKMMRQTFDDLWIIDLEGDNLGARKSENVFAIQTPVAIAIGVRYDDPKPDTPALVHYTRIEGTRDEKLKCLEAIDSFADLPWQPGLGGWMDPLLPTSDKAYWNWPLLTDLFPWQENGVQFKRTWPIAEDRGLLLRRWKHLVSLPVAERKRALRETDARTIIRRYATPGDDKHTLQPIGALTTADDPANPIRYAFRSFDRQWALLDIRLCDRPRPELLAAHSDRQVYMTSLLTNVLGDGPSAVSTHLIPDLDHFRGSFGAKHVIALWRDRDGTEANVTGGLLDRLGTVLDCPVSAEDLFAYCYTVLATPKFVREFWDELTIPGPRVPISKNPALFEQAVTLGRRLIWLHTFGERFIPSSEKRGKVPQGRARCEIGTPSSQEEYPEDFAYSARQEELRVGKGLFSGVRQEVWEFSVSGLAVVKSWLAYRMRKGAGRKSSPLDDIRPDSWQFDGELLDLLWVLDATIDMQPELARVLKQVLAGDTFTASELPAPLEIERGNSGARATVTKHQQSGFDGFAVTT